MGKTPELNSIERAVIKELQPISGKVSMETICQKLWLTYTVAFETLETLELKGQIKVEWHDFPKWPYLESV